MKYTKGQILLLKESNILVKVTEAYANKDNEARYNLCYVNNADMDKIPQRHTLAYCEQFSHYEFTLDRYFIPATLAAKVLYDKR